MKHRLIPMLLALLLLSGCAALVPSEYTVVTEHTETVVEEDSDALTAESYDELKYAILTLIEDGTAHGVIRAYHYDGDVTKDISSAAYEVWKNDPMGAYAVEFITTDCNLLLSYDEIHVEITYRQNAADAADISYVRGSAGARQAIETALAGMADRLVLRISAYPEELDCEALVSAYCEAHPETQMECPAVSAAVYPDNGSIRILDLQFTYEHTVDERKTMQSAVSTVLNSAANYVRYRNEDSAKAELLCSYLLDRFDYTEGESVTPVYSLLCEGVADSRTFAQIYQILCDRVGLECCTVSGYLDGESYAWNIINIDGVYRHLDLMRCVRDGVGQFTLYSDSEMERYSWDRTAYPSCSDKPEALEEPEGPSGEQTWPEQPSGPEIPAEPEEPTEPDIPQGTDSEDQEMPETP